MGIEISTGNAIVDAVGKMNFRGNVIPESWYHTIINEKGKPYLLAIVLLSEIVYWYRPTEVRDELSNNLKFKKKFYYKDFLQKGYEELSEKFGMSNKQIRCALAKLESLGVVKRHFRNIKTSMGIVPNRMFLELVPDVLYKLTYLDGEGYIVKKGNIDKIDNTLLPECHDKDTNEESYVDEEVTNTTTTTKNTTETTTQTTTDVADSIKIRKLFDDSGLKLTESEVESLIKVSGYNYYKCDNALSVLADSKSKIKNVYAWLKKAITEGYTKTEYVPKSATVKEYSGRHYTSEYYAELEKVGRRPL